MDATNTGFATDQVTGPPETALVVESSDDDSDTEGNEPDLIIDQVLQEMGIVLDDEKRHLLKSIPESSGSVERVREWAAAVARHRMGRLYFDKDKITWRGSDLHNCVLRTQDADGNTCRPGLLTQMRCRLFDHQDGLSWSLRDELNDDAVLLVHVRKAAGRKGAQWRREEPRDESDDHPPDVVYYFLVSLVAVMYFVLLLGFLCLIRGFLCP